jgi:hypothetical protein
MQARTSRLTYLDTSFAGGRPVIILKKSNCVNEHIRDFTVTYDFKTSNMLWVRRVLDTRLRYAASDLIGLFRSPCTSWRSSSPST